MKKLFLFCLILICPLILFCQSLSKNRNFTPLATSDFNSNKLTLEFNNDSILKPVFPINIGYILIGGGFGGSGFYSKAIEYTLINGNIGNGALNLSVGVRAGFKNIIEYEYQRSVDITHQIKVNGEKTSQYLYEFEHLLKINPYFRTEREFYPNLIVGIGNCKYTSEYDDGWWGKSYIIGTEYFFMEEGSWGYHAFSLGIKFYKIIFDEYHHYGIINPIDYKGFQFLIDLKMYFGLAY